VSGKAPPAPVSSVPVQGRRLRLNRKIPHMLDVIMLGLGLAFFAVAVGYTLLCDRL
jgi:hypothetical protein